jgi:tryptophan synthase alpha chain
MTATATDAGPLERALRAARDAGRKLLVPYVTGGITPDWTEVVSAFGAAGADAIEIGIPFSDPVMDGPTIQAASTRALEAGATPDGILAALGRLEESVPLVAMTYYNIVYRAGHLRFARRLRDHGVVAAIVPDLPLEESGEWEAEAAGAGVETVLLAAPVTTDERLHRICQRTRGFVYGVGLMGVTGERGAVAESSLRIGARLKAATDKPVVIGFGVSNAEQACQVAQVADGVVIASALMRRILDGAGVDAVADEVATIRRALDGLAP